MTRKLVFFVILLGLVSAFSSGPNVSLDNFRQLFVNDVPMMDVRSPCEYSKGSFPSSTNLPLLTNEERHQVGICYQQYGQEAAIRLGNQFVSGSTKADRMKQWMEFVATHSSSSSSSSSSNGLYLYCFRGGLRSHIVQQWIENATGIRYPIVTGGYKAMRQFLREELETNVGANNNNNKMDLFLICGKTGTGKTEAIRQLHTCSVDLEGLACHRGSSFGQIPEHPDQPSQTDFENNVSIEFMKALDRNNREQQRQKCAIFVEDEGNRIGKLGLPLVLKNRMKACDGIIVIEEDLEKRIDRIFKDYVFDLCSRFVVLYGEERGQALHQQYLLSGLKRIQNRLGGDRYSYMVTLMTQAFQQQHTMADTTLHRVWIGLLLEQYYDKMYDYQLSQREDQVLFRGKREEVIDWVSGPQSCLAA